MEHIYTITTIDNKKVPDCRCVGFYFNVDVAKQEVLNNSGDIFEFSYTYCVIEEVGEGIYYYPRKEFWFKWNYEEKKYVALETKPERFNNIGGFGIG